MHNKEILFYIIAAHFVLNLDIDTVKKYTYFSNFNSQLSNFVPVYDYSLYNSLNNALLQLTIHCATNIKSVCVYIDREMTIKYHIFASIKVLEFVNKFQITTPFPAFSMQSFFVIRVR